MHTVQRAFRQVNSGETFRIEFEEDLLGEAGASGQVHRIITVETRPTSSWVIKLLNQSSANLIQRLQALVQFLEINQLNTEALSCVPAAVFEDTTDARLAIVMRCAPGADLETGGGVPSGASLAKRLAAGYHLANAVDRLHSHDVIIGDLAHDNLIINPRNWALYIIDVDSAGFSHGQQYPCVASNASKWELGPPELKQGESYSAQMDLWGLAVLLHYVLTDTNPMSFFGMARTYAQPHPFPWPPDAHPKREEHLEKLKVFGEPLAQAFVSAFAEHRILPMQRASAAHWKELLDSAQHHMYECDCSIKDPFVALGSGGVFVTCPRCGRELASRAARR